jgi:hypothetical protein
MNACTMAPPQNEMVHGLGGVRYGRGAQLLLQNAARSHVQPRRRAHPYQTNLIVHLLTLSTTLRFAVHFHRPKLRLRLAVSS